ASRSVIDRVVGHAIRRKNLGAVGEDWGRCQPSNRGFSRRAASEGSLGDQQGRGGVGVVSVPGPSGPYFRVGVQTESGRSGPNAGALEKRWYRSRRDNRGD